MKIKNIKSIVLGWKNGIYSAERALEKLLKELSLEGRQ